MSKIQEPSISSPDSHELSEKAANTGHPDYHGIDARALPMGADEVYEKKIAIMNEALIDLVSFDSTSDIFWFWMQAITIISAPVKTEFAVKGIAIQAICGIPASIIGGFTVDMKHIGRKGTGTIACICTGLFLFLFTRANTGASVLGFTCVTCAIAFFQNLVYGLLYSYTPELFPAPIRGTANGLVALFNRLSGLMAPIIAAYVSIETDTTVWIPAALSVVAGFVFLALPYEMRGRAAS
ncbi:major facilitator superfamily domain-containing protein [Lophiotrema nucula]|uniref:Major facilitator superfamily domain-containing protein n=1 Tax=Lophiotrema nucula TaxID=690887 RepID=A0A6A5YNS3_9PLEO|nr:major facilitator superfamily domain-containing protein [Lophiotrema nucula]